MARTFDVPVFYRAPLVTRLKQIRQLHDPLKRDLSPSVLDFGPVSFKLARHFGFCFGVENAVEIAYKTLAEHTDRRIFLLSEMIHNPRVNEDLQSRGIRFMRSTQGEQLIPFDELNTDDIVLTPAFGTTVEIERELIDRGLDIRPFDTTCPFVEKVWKRSAQIGQKNFTVVVHGKRFHEETRATFSHANETTAVIVVLDLKEAVQLASIITGDAAPERFFDWFEDRYSDGFDPQIHLSRIGVVNQTTMLATETSEISRVLKEAMSIRFGPDQVDSHFADTSDTLCYATNENQTATHELVRSGADLAIVVGGTNSSNTSHLAEICAEVMPTFFITGSEQLAGPDQIEHFDVETQQFSVTKNWLDTSRPTDILLSAGASCPDILLDEVIQTVVSYFDSPRPVDEVLRDFSEAQT